MIRLGWEVSAPLAVSRDFSTRISHQAAMLMLKKNSFFSIYPAIAKVSQGQTARSRALAGLFALSAHMLPQT